MDNKILFQTNVAQELSLAFLEGKPVEGRFGDQYLFSTTDGRVFYVSTTVGQIIEKQLLNLKVQVGEPVEIGKFEIDMGRGRKGIQWVVKRVGYAPGQQPDGTFVTAGADASTSAPATSTTTATKNGAHPIGGGPVNGHHTNGNGDKPAIADFGIHQGWAQYTLSLTHTLVDMYVAATKHASDKYGNAVKADDVRSLLTTVFINVTKNGGVK